MYFHLCFTSFLGDKIDLNPSVGVGIGFDGCISDISIGGNGDSGTIDDLASAVIHASNVAECNDDDVGCGDK